MRWMHPNPRKRYGMEVARFVIYLAVPVVVIEICSDPKNMNKLLRGLKFVEYPPEAPGAKKFPSGGEIVKMMEEREAKRRVAAARSGVDAHMAAVGATKQQSSAPAISDTTIDATAAVQPDPKSPSPDESQPPIKGKKGWFGGWR